MGASGGQHFQIYIFNICRASKTIQKCLLAYLPNFIFICYIFFIFYRKFRRKLYKIHSYDTSGTGICGWGSELWHVSRLKSNRTSIKVKISNSHLPLVIYLMKHMYVSIMSSTLKKTFETYVCIDQSILLFPKHFFSVKTVYLTIYLKHLCIHVMFYFYIFC